MGSRVSSRWWALRPVILWLTSQVQCLSVIKSMWSFGTNLSSLCMTGSSDPCSHRPPLLLPEPALQTSYEIAGAVDMSFDCIWESPLLNLEICMPWESHRPTGVRGIDASAFFTDSG